MNFQRDRPRVIPAFPAVRAGSASPMTEHHGLREEDRPCSSARPIAAAGRILAVCTVVLGQVACAAEDDMSNAHLSAGEDEPESRVEDEPHPTARHLAEERLGLEGKSLHPSMPPSDLYFFEERGYWRERPSAVVEKFTSGLEVRIDPLDPNHMSGKGVAVTAVTPGSPKDTLRVTASPAHDVLDRLEIGPKVRCGGASFVMATVSWESSGSSAARRLQGVVFEVPDTSEQHQEGRAHAWYYLGHFSRLAGAGTVGGTGDALVTPECEVQGWALVTAMGAGPYRGGRGRWTLRLELDEWHGEEACEIEPEAPIRLGLSIVRTLPLADDGVDHRASDCCNRDFDAAGLHIVPNGESWGMHALHRNEWDLSSASPPTPEETVVSELLKMRGTDSMECVWWH